MPPFSLLWPPDTSATTAAVMPLEPQSARDLGLESCVRALSNERMEQDKIRQILLNLCPDTAVIRYRQDILADLLHQPELVNVLTQLAPIISALSAYRSAVDRPRTTLEEVTWRLGELEQFVGCVDTLHQMFGKVGEQLQAAGWQTLRQLVAQTAEEPTFQHLHQALPAMLSQIRVKASVTIGVNLDAKLRPEAATLLSVNEQKFTSATFLDKLMGKEATRALGPLHTVPQIDAGRDAREWDGREVNPLMVPLFKDLAKVLENISKPLAKALSQYVGIQSGYLAAVSGEIAFYLAAVRLVKRLSGRGLPICRPHIAPAEARLCHLKEGYNLNLALNWLSEADIGSTAPHTIIPNETAMDDDGRIFILTGPNQGGKTTYTQMIGLCQLLAQAGLWVPAAEATISPVDNIYTHYPVEEKLEQATGRFGDEAQRLSEIFAKATRHSLLLLNESLASTSPGEALYVAQDIVRILRRMGVRAIFGTHLHELAASVAELNASTQGDSLVVSMVASRIETGGDGHGRSYRVERGQPLGRSYAREIAQRYGISYEQLAAQLQSRGVIQDP